jgi:hypothetical protein
MAQHKWHKEIKAWADGAEIESKLDSEYGDWFLCLNPIWNDEAFIHRIKPQPKEPQYLYVYANEDAEPCLFWNKITPLKTNLVYQGKIKLEVDDGN